MAASPLSPSKPTQRAIRCASGVAALLASCFGCAAGVPGPASAHEHWVPGYAFGLWGKADLDVRDDCPTAGAESVRIGTTWSTLLVSAATLGVYTPREVRVRCRPQ